MNKNEFISLYENKDTREKLLDVTLLPDLRNLVLENESNKDNEFRCNVYSAMHLILSYNLIPEYCQFLVDRLKVEKTKMCIDSLLRYIEFLSDIPTTNGPIRHRYFPDTINMDPIIELTKFGKSQLTNAAIQALKVSNTEKCRDALRYWVNQDDEKKYQYEIYYANHSLGFIGKPEDIPLLEKHINSKKSDMKATAEWAINSIKKRYDTNRPQKAIIKNNRNSYINKGQIIANNCIDYVGEANWKEMKELWSLTGKEAKEYYLWFLKQKDVRIKYLQQYLKEHNYNFDLDFTDESIKDIWTWYRDVMKSIDNTVKKDKSNTKELFDILAKIRVDIAIYFGETLIHNYPTLKWDYIKESKQYVYYNNLAIIGFRFTSYVIPTEEVRKSNTDEMLRHFESNLYNYYEYWEEYV